MLRAPTGRNPFTPGAGSSDSEGLAGWPDRCGAAARELPLRSRCSITQEAVLPCWVVAQQAGTVFALLKRQAICVGGRYIIVRHLSWSNYNCSSQIGRVQDHERVDEGDLLG